MAVNRICKKRGCKEAADILGFGNTKNNTDSWFCLQHWLKEGTKYQAYCSASETRDGDMFRIALARAREKRDCAEGERRRAWARAVVGMCTINERHYKHMRREEMGNDE